MSLALNQHRYDNLHALRREVYATIGWDYQAPSLPPEALLPMQAWRMISSQTGLFKCHGALKGTGFKDQAFSLVDVTAQVRPKKTEQQFDFSSPGFQGVIISLPHHTSFMGRTIIAKDKGAFNPSTIDLMKRVGFVSSEFEKIFEVYSDDQTEARALITPDFMERLNRFSGEVLGHNIQCVFWAGQIHIALDIDDTFQFSHDYAPVNFERTRRTIIAEVGTVCILLEKLQTLQSRVGRGGDLGADKARKAHYLGKLEQLADKVRSLEPDGQWTKKMPAGMEDNHYLFCDSLKGLLYPRM